MGEESSMLPISFYFMQFNCQQSVKKPLTSFDLVSKLRKGIDSVYVKKTNSPSGESGLFLCFYLFLFFSILL